MKLAVKELKHISPSHESLKAFEADKEIETITCDSHFVWRVGFNAAERRFLGQMLFYIAGLRPAKSVKSGERRSKRAKKNKTIKNNDITIHTLKE